MHVFIPLSKDGRGSSSPPKRVGASENVRGSRVHERARVTEEEREGDTVKDWQDFCAFG